MNDHLDLQFILLSTPQGELADGRRVYVYERPSGPVVHTTVQKKTKKKAVIVLVNVFLILNSRGFFHHDAEKFCQSFLDTV